MKYQVLARKYRPKTFSTMIGQEHVLKALSNALESERLHHAYLFTGTRGVGKTTVARVLAKALNCEQGIQATPCGECSACQEIDQGRFIDLLEVDAASRTKVEDTRELLDNVQYAPTRGRFKIYLIDEVHMLSGHSFNALLKTLEEPPSHVKFLLATTDPQKLPVTILSRCLQFNLKRLTIGQIEQQLAQILSAEKLTFEQSVLKPLAIAADGSMRDALSLLDQSIAYSNGQPNLADVEAMLGSVQKHRIFELLIALANENGRSLIDQSCILIDQGIDVNTILAELITTLQRIALCQLVPDVIDDSLGDKEMIEQVAQLISPEDIQLYYQIALNGRKDLPYSPQPQSGFEMILLRMLAFKPVGLKTQLATIQSHSQEKKTQLKSPAISSKQSPTASVEKVALEKSSKSLLTPEPRLDEPLLSNTRNEDKNQPQVKTEEQIKAQPQNQPDTIHYPQKNKSDQSNFDLPPVEAYGEEFFFDAQEQDISPAAEIIEKEVIPEQPQSNLEHAFLKESLVQETPVQETPVQELSVKKSASELPCNKADNSELAEYWHDLILQIGISGLEQQLAKHCALIKKSIQKGDQLFELLLESVHKHLCNDKIKNRLIDALQQKLGSNIILDIKECQVEQQEQLDTPRRREIYEEQLRQQQAVESIFSDPKVKLLIDAFAATVREETITAI